jgi:hypothetical protein
LRISQSTFAYWFIASHNATIQAPADRQIQPCRANGELA